MIKLLSAVFFAALLTGGIPSLIAQGADASRDENAEPPRLTPDERRARWEELRELSAEERRARFLELRENRREARGERFEEPEASVPPENYLDQLEFRSILTLDGVTEFTLRSPYEDRSFTLSAGETRNGVEVLEFDSEENALTLGHDGKTRTLFLQASQVAALEGEGDGTAGRLQRWELGRERFRQFRETWRKAAETSPELREIEGQFRELAADFRHTRSLLRETESGSPEHEKLRTQEQELREEFRLLTEYSILEVNKNPAFDEQATESLAWMMRGMMFRGGMDGEGYRGRTPR